MGEGQPTRGKSPSALSPPAIFRSRFPAVCLLSTYLSILPAVLLTAAHEADAPLSTSGSPALSAAPSLPVIRPAPDFTLLDAAGRAVRLSELRGRVVLVSFIYTSCSSACPLLTARMAVLQQRLRDTGVAGGRVRFLSLTVDPARDSADALGRYAKSFVVDPGAWQFLRGEPEELSPALAAYDEWTRVLPNGEIDHPARLYLIDQRGQIREIYSLSFFDERQAFLDILVLLRASP